MAQKLILGIDTGLNEVKVVGKKGELKFPSLIDLQPENHVDFSQFNSFNEEENDIEFIIEYDGESYFVGEHAVFETTEKPITGNRDGSKNDEDAFLKAVAAVCRYVDTYEDFEDTDIEVYMGYGSPIKKWADKKEQAEITNRFINKGKPHEIVFNDIPLNITFKDIDVLAEGIAAAYSQPMKGKEIYIVDAGSQTINLTAIINGRVSNRSKNTEVGVEEFKKKYGSKAAKQLAKSILKAINVLKWGEKENTKYTIYVCGGYANQLADAFNDLEDDYFEMQVMRPEVAQSARKTKVVDAIYANAAGMYYFAKGKVAKSENG